MNTQNIIRAAFTGAVALLAACGDSTGPDKPSNSNAGSLGFSYSGDRVGSYSASGVFSRDGGSPFVKQPFATGIRNQAGGQQEMVLLSYTPVSAATGNMVLFIVPNVTATGGYPLHTSCTDDADCPFAGVFFDTDPGVEEDDSEAYVFTDGTLNVTSVTDGHLRGTFSGTAATLSGERVITVADGSFDVPVKDGGTLGPALTRIPVRSGAR